MASPLYVNVCSAFGFSPYLAFRTSGESFWGPAVGVFGRRGGQGFELGDELAESAGVVEPGLVAVELVVVEAAGDGLAGDFAGPGPVGAVEVGGVGVAAAVGIAAAAGSVDHAARQAEAEGGDLLEDLAAAGVGLV